MILKGLAKALCGIWGVAVSTIRFTPTRCYFDRLARAEMRGVYHFMADRQITKKDLLLLAWLELATKEMLGGEK